MEVKKSPKIIGARSCDYIIIDNNRSFIDLYDEITVEFEGDVKHVQKSSCYQHKYNDKFLVIPIRAFNSIPKCLPEDFKKITTHKISTGNYQLDKILFDKGIIIVDIITKKSLLAFKTNFKTNFVYKKFEKNSNIHLISRSDIELLIISQGDKLYFIPSNSHIVSKTTGNRLQVYLSKKNKERFDCKLSILNILKKEKVHVEEKYEKIWKEESKNNYYPKQHSKSFTSPNEIQEIILDILCKGIDFKMEIKLDNIQKLILTKNAMYLERARSKIKSSMVKEVLDKIQKGENDGSKDCTGVYTGRGIGKEEE